MSSKSVFAAVVGGLLLVLSSRGRTEAPTPSPQADAYVVAVKARETYRKRVGPAARDHGAKIKAGEFKTSLDEATAWAGIAKGIAKDSTDGITKAFADVSKQTKDLPVDEGRQVRGDWFINFGNGWDK